MHDRLIAALTLTLFAIAPRASAGQEAPARDVRERLTEREDENRIEDPWTLPVFGHPLTARGQYEIQLEGTDPFVRGTPPEGDDRLLLEQELEGELFYTIGRPLSLFVQARLRWDRDTLAHTRHGADDWYVERGEMWLFTENLFGTGIDFDVGRLEFEDDRRWWWDAELDAMRVAWEGGHDEVFGASLAVGWELGPHRSDQHDLPADERDRLRVLGELSWEPAAHHEIGLFVLFESDRSERSRVGALVRTSQIDESDARLLWLGPRVLGGFVSPSTWIVGYWVDGGFVHGREAMFEHGEPEAGFSPVESAVHRDVDGWAVDLGLTCVAPLPLEPHVTLAYAIGSGDGGDGQRDHSYRQSDIHANETALGGVRRFASYGVLLDPELSNLAVATAGVGISLLSASSLDLVYHHYELVQRADSLRSSRLETELDGRHRALGHGLDLVLAIEEGDVFEIEVSGSLFRGGSAFGAHRGDWAYGGLAALRIAF